MENGLFNNSHIISWLQYFSDNTDIDLEHVKILDITKKNKNLIPACEVHRCVLVFTEAGHADIFYRMYNAYDAPWDVSGFPLRWALKPLEGILVAKTYELSPTMFYRFVKAKKWI